MKTDLIRRLNQLNQQFYQQISGEFAATRQTAWPGWEKLINLRPTSNSKQLTRVLDLGCGHGRWATFHFQHLPLPQKMSYLGIDQNPALLALADQELAAYRQAQPDRFNYQLLEVDLVSTLLNQQPILPITQPKFDLIIAMGLWHHLPGATTRRSLLTAAHQLLAPQGQLVIAAWQFITEPRLKARLIDPSTLGLNTNDLEPNDYFLDWRAGQTAVRYCHATSEAEITADFAATNWKIEQTFKADGQSQQLNLYVIARPS